MVSMLVFRWRSIKCVGKLDSQLLFRIRSCYLVSTSIQSDIEMQKLMKHKAEPGKLVKLFKEIKTKNIPYNCRTANIKLCCLNNHFLSAKNIWNEIMNNNKCFNEIHQQDICEIMSAFLSQKYYVTTLDIFDESITHNIQSQNVSKPHPRIYHLAITAATNIKSLNKAQNIYDIIMNKQPNFICDEKISNNLMNMFIKCGDLDRAMEMFQNVSNKASASTWAILIDGMIEDNKVCESFKLFNEMVKRNIQPNSFCYSSICKAVIKTKSTRHAYYIYEMIIIDSNIDLYNNVVLITSIITMFGSCGDNQKSNEIWENLLKNRPNIPNIHTWNAMMSINLNVNNYKKTLQLYDQLLDFRRNNSHNNILHKLNPNVNTFIRCIEACTKLPDLEKGKEIHKYIMFKFVRNMHKDIQSSLINMYIECIGDFHRGIKTWKDIMNQCIPIKHSKCKLLAYRIMILMYIEYGDNLNAFKCFDEIQNEYKIIPDAYLITVILKACDQTTMIDEMYQYITSLSLELINNEKVVSAFIDAYIECGNTQKAEILKNKRF